MRMIIFALLLAISYAQTEERRSLSFEERRSLQPGSRPGGGSGGGGGGQPGGGSSGGMMPGSTTGGCEDTPGCGVFTTFGDPDCSNELARQACPATCQACDTAVNPDTDAGTDEEGKSCEDKEFNGMSCTVALAMPQIDCTMAGLLCPVSCDMCDKGEWECVDMDGFVYNGMNCESAAQANLCETEDVAGKCPESCQLCDDKEGTDACALCDCSVPILCPDDVDCGCSDENETNPNEDATTTEECEDTDLCAGFSAVGAPDCTSTAVRLACKLTCNACDETVIDNIPDGGDIIDNLPGDDDANNLPGDGGDENDETPDTTEECVDTALCAGFSAAGAPDCTSTVVRLACASTCNACDETLIDNLPGDGGDGDNETPTTEECVDTALCVGFSAAGAPDCASTTARFACRLTCNACDETITDNLPDGGDIIDNLPDGGDIVDNLPGDDSNDSSETTEECEDTALCLADSPDCTSTAVRLVCKLTCNACDEEITDNIPGGGDIIDNLPGDSGDIVDNIPGNDGNDSSEEEESEESDEESTSSEAPSKQVKFEMKLSMTRDQFEEKKSDVKKSVAETLRVDEDSIEVNAKSRRRLRRQLTDDVEIEVIVRTDEDTAQRVETSVSNTNRFTRDLSNNLEANIPDIDIEVSDVGALETIDVTDPEDVGENLTGQNNTESESDDGGMDTMVVIIIALGAVVFCLLVAAGYYAFTGSKMESEVIDMGERVDTENPATVGGAAFDSKRHPSSQEGAVAFETGSRP